MSTRRAVPAILALLLLVAPSSAQPIPRAPVRTGPDAVLVWGRGLHHVDLATGRVTTWLDDSHEVRRLCVVPGEGGGAGTVFVVEGDGVSRLAADTGRPVVLRDADAADPRAVVAREIIDLAGGRTLATLQRDRLPDGSGSGRPFWVSADPTGGGPAPAVPGPEATSPVLRLLPWEGGWLDEEPDRLAFNHPLLRMEGNGEVFVALSPDKGLGPRLWTTTSEAPRPAPQPAEEGWFVLGFAMAAEAPRCFALLASPFSYTRLMVLDFPEGLAGGTWSTLNTKLPVADPQIMSLYLCSSDGSLLLAGNGYRIDVIDGARGGRRATLFLQGVVRDSEAVVDMCLVGVPHDDARHAFTPAQPGDACRGDEAWVAGLARAVDVHGLETGGMKLAAWDLADGSLKTLLDVPSGVTQVTAIPADLEPGWFPAAPPSAPPAGDPASAPGAGPR